MALAARALPQGQRRQPVAIVTSGLENLLEVLEHDRTVPHASLALLSGLEPEALAIFRQSWGDIPVKTRRQVAAQLSDMAEDNALLDFGNVFLVCLEDEDSEVRLKAVSGLSLSEDRTCLSPLLRRLRDEPDEGVRATVALALGDFVLKAEFEQLPSSDARRLENALTSVIADAGEGLEVRRRAVEAISAFSGNKVQDIIRAAYHSPHLRMQASALHAMGRNCDPQWLPLLLTEMRSGEPELRYEAAQACGEIEDQRAVPRLIELTRDQDSDVRRAAIEALGHIGGDAAKRALQGLAQDTSLAVRESAADALELVRFDENPLVLTDGLDDGEDEDETEDQ